MRRLLVLLSLVIALGSCVQNRKYVYLQKDDLNIQRSLADTVSAREYDITTFEYKLQSMDNLMIRFESLTPEDFDFLSQEVTQMQMANPATAFLMGEMIDEAGNIRYPVIGDVRLAGLTVFEAEQKLTKLASEFLESPKVVVRLANGRITVLGEVVREGVVPLNNNRLSMIEVIGFAGGLSEFADRDNIKLIRQQENGAKVYYLNLLEEDFLKSPLYYAHQGDILIVPPLKQRPFRRYFGPNLALLVSTVTLLLLTYNIVK